MIKPYVLIATVALVLAGCGSNVKLDPEIDRTPGASAGSGAGGAGAQAQGAAQGGVTPVRVGGPDGSTAAVPSGLPRVVYFDFDSFVVKPEFQPVVDQNARFLRANPARKVVLEGNTDERGSREYNLALGQKRAEAVRRALVLVGAQDSQIEAVSFGKEKPAVQGSNEEAWAKNRRVEFRY